MPRKRLEKPRQIKDLDDANRALKEIAELQIQLESIDGEAAREIGEIKEKAAKAGEKSRKRIAEIESGLNLFAEYNKDDLFQNRKTIELSYGPIGFRKSTKVKTKKSTLDLLKKLFPGKAVRIKETIDKDELKEFSDENLAKVDSAKVTDDVFWYEINRDMVNQDIMERTSA